MGVGGHAAWRAVVHGAAIRTTKLEPAQRLLTPAVHIYAAGTCCVHL